ncbi:MAG: sulfotransferase family protein, partial [Nitrososphaera sp.]
MKERWPNFFIVGAPKAGTTSLYYYLKKTPGIFMSSVKEPNYFACNIVASSTFDVITNKHEYLGLFRNSDKHIAVGEASVCYLWDPSAPMLIKASVPDARIIILLRDPIERAFSDYLMRKKYGGDNASFYTELVLDSLRTEKLFGSCALYVELGMYYEQVKRYFEHFGRDRVMVIIFEEFIKNKQDTLKNVLSFLGIDSALPEMDEQYNKYSEPRNHISLRVFAFFRYLRSRGIPFYKVLGILPES